MANKNPDAYNPDLATAQNTLGYLYRNLKRFEEAETVYTEALDIYEELAVFFAGFYFPEVAITQYNLGILYKDLGRFEEAETAYTEALDIFTELADKPTYRQKNSSVYKPKVAMVWYNKACLESLRNNNEKSIEFLKKAIDLDKEYIEMAKSDEDFSNIRTSKEFKELIGE